MAFCERTEVFTLAESLGAVESLVEHPARMTHASAAGSPLEVAPGLVRLSVGIESVSDLVADLRQALDSLITEALAPIPCGGRRRRPVRCRPDGGAARPVRLPASPRGHGGDHRGLRRRPSRAPGGDRRGPPARRRAGPGDGGGHVRPPPGVGRAARVRTPPAHRPRPEARAAGRDGRRLLPGHHVRRGPQPRAGRRVRARGPGRVPRRPGSSWSATTSTSGTSGPGTWRCCARWAPSSASTSRDSTWSAPTGGPAGDADPVSSTRIRHALAEGDLALANALLGRPYEVRGVVARGDKRGRELGFPTANVSVPGDVLLPADGIYAGWYERPDGEVHADRHLARPAPDLLRRGARQPARGPPPRLLGRPLRRARQGAVRRLAARRGSSSRRSTTWSPRSAATATTPAASSASLRCLSPSEAVSRPGVRHRVVTLTVRERVPVRAYRVSQRRHRRRGT